MGLSVSLTARELSEEQRGGAAGFVSALSGRTGFAYKIDPCAFAPDAQVDTAFALCYDGTELAGVAVVNNFAAVESEPEITFVCDNDAAFGALYAEIAGRYTPENKGTWREIWAIADERDLGLIARLTGVGFFRSDVTERSLVLDRAAFSPVCADGVTVRRAECSDGETIRALNVDFFGGEGGDGETVTDGEIGKTAFAVYNGRVVGKVFSEGYGGVRGVYGFGVTSEFRSRGIGGAFLSAFIENSFKEGYNKITLQVGLGNERAARLYGRLGFRENARFAYFKRG